jgi:catechol 2,3-dioxygenase-like lactoylglutathione lyase family enzyme
MKRFHVHVAVEDLAASIRFRSALFGTEPALRKPDDAKWQLDGPRLNFAISNGRGVEGVNHLGIQTDSDEATLPAAAGCCTMESTLPAKIAVKSRAAACCGS